MTTYDLGTLLATLALIFAVISIVCFGTYFILRSNRRNRP